MKKSILVALLVSLVSNPLALCADSDPYQLSEAALISRIEGHQNQLKLLEAQIASGRIALNDDLGIAMRKTEIVGSVLGGITATLWLSAMHLDRSRAKKAVSKAAESTPSSAASELLVTAHSQVTSTVPVLAMALTVGGILSMITAGYLAATANPSAQIIDLTPEEIEFLKKTLRRLSNELGVYKKALAEISKSNLVIQTID